MAAVFAMAWGMVFLTGTQLGISGIGRKTMPCSVPSSGFSWVFLGLEERAGCFWCCRKLFGDFIKIKMKTGSMAYVMEHRLYGLFFA